MKSMLLNRYNINRGLWYKTLLVLLCGCFSITLTHAQNNALHFDGVNDFMVCNGPTNYNLGTWEAWIQKTNWADHHDDYLFGNTYDASIDESFYISLHPTVGLHFRMSNTANYVSYNGTKNFAPNSWHHIAATWSLTGLVRTQKLYVDGALVASLTWSSTIPAFTNIGVFLVGGNGMNLTQQFGTGAMDEIRVWNVERTAAQIANDYAKTTTYPQTNLMNLVNFNAGNPGGVNASTFLDLATANSIYSLANFALNGNTSNYITSTKATITSIDANPIPLNATIPSSINYYTPGDLITIQGSNLLGATPSSVTIGSTPVNSILSNNGTKMVVVSGNGGNNSITTVTPLSGASKSEESLTLKGDHVLHFDGVDDYVSRADSATNLANPINGADGTWEAWVQKSNWADHHDDRLYGNGINFNSSGSFYVSLHPGVGFHFRYGGSNEAGNNYASSTLTQSFAANSWHHLAATWHWNGTATELKIYADGVLLNSSLAYLQLNLTNPTYVGGDASNPKFGSGSMDDIRLWSVARSASDITSTMYRSNLQAAGLVQSENFNEGIASGNNTAILSLQDDVNVANAPFVLNNFTRNGSSSNFIADTKTKITALSATNGTAGSTLTIYGANLTGATASSVTIGGVPVTSIVSNNGTALVVTVGSGNSGVVSVTTPNGGKALSLQTFTFTLPENAMHFDGVNDFIDLGIYPGVFYTNNFTVEAWFNTANANAHLLSKRAACGASNFWNLIIASGKVTWELYNGAGQSFTLQSPLTYNNSLWHHAAVTRNGTQVKMYVDGQLVNSGTSPVVININDSTVAHTMIGKNPCGFFGGMADEIRIWNTERSATEIATNYNHSLVLPQTGLTTYINFNQGIAGGNNTTISSVTNAVTGAVFPLSNFTLNGATSNFVNATLVPTPGISDLSAKKICIGLPLTIYGSNLSNVLANEIKIGGIAVSSILSSTNNQLVVMPAAPATGKVIIQSLAGYTVSDSVEIVSNTLVVSASASANAICMGGSVSVQGSGAQNYAWSGGVSNGVLFTPTATGTYTVTGTDNFGCTATSSVTVVINPNPSITPPVGGSICSGTPFSFTATATTPCNFTWSNSVANGTSAILNAVSSSYTVTATDIATTCTATATVSVLLQPCNAYCTSAASTSADEDIYRVTINGVSTNPLYANANNCTTVAPGPGSILKRYSNFTTLGPLTTISKGISVPFEVRVNECDGIPYYNNKVGIWIDLNNNGLFTDAGEQLYVQPAATPASSSGDKIVTGNILVPMDALIGNLRLRVVCIETSGTITPCVSYNYGETEDYLINVQEPPVCNGTPNPNVAVSSTSLACNGVPFTLSLQNLFLETGYTFQWYANGDPIAGANLSSLTTSMSANTTFMCSITCQQSGITINSSPVSVGLNNFLNCYCIPVIGACNSGDHITNVTLPASVNPINNTTGTCLNAGYSDYKSLPVAKLHRGDTLPISVSVFNGGLEYAGAWVDFNQSGSFEMNEFISLLDANGTAPWLFNGSLIVPINAMLGNTVLRVRSRYGTAMDGTQSCLNYTYGETEDYLVEILPYEPGNTLSSSSALCSGQLFTLSVQHNCDGVYQWQQASDAAFTSNVVNLGNTLTQSITISETNYYRCLISLDNQTYYSNPIQVSVLNNPVISSITASNLSPCVGETISMQATATGCGNITISNFTGIFAPYHWNSIASNPGDGYSDTSNAPMSVSLIYPSGSGNSALLDYQIQIAYDGTLTFDWTHTTNIPGLMPLVYPNVAVNNNPAFIMNGFSQFGSGSQNGSQTLTVTAGDVVHLIAFDAYGVASGNAITTISNLSFVTSSCSPNIVWMPGNVIGANQTFTPTTTTTYTATVTGGNGCVSKDSLSVNVQNCSVTFNVKSYIQGYYISGGIMNAVLSNQGLSNPINDCDSMEVSLHNSTAPYALVETYKGVLQTNGTLACNFSGAVAGQNYYIVLRSRNGLETWSAAPVMITNAASYDFSSGATQAFGDNQLEVETGVFALYSGDVNQDGSIDAFDYLVMDPDITDGNSGYYATDLNGDGSVDAFDYLIIDVNIIAGLGLATP